MKKPKLDFKSLTIALKIQKAREIVVKLTGNVNFPSPNPTLPVMTTAINTLETAFEAAADGGKSLKANMRAKEKILDDFIILLQEYVGNASGGDEQKILSTGFNVKKVGTRGKRQMKIVATKNPGEVILTADTASDKPIAAFEWQYALETTDSTSDVEDNRQWIAIDITTGATKTINSLTVGANYWFRYRTIHAKDTKGSWIVMGMILIPKF
jgi:hypothetical protein